MDKLPFSVILGFLLGMLVVNQTSASQTYWFSDSAPTAELAKKLRPSHGGLVKRGKRGMYTKQLWLREGEDPTISSYVMQSDARLILVDPDNKQTELAFDNKGYADISFDMPVEGFYNLFMINKEVDERILRVSVVKNEPLNHSCRAGHDHVKKKMPPTHFQGTPLDIIRERAPKETFHSRKSSGDIINYKILLHGKPVDGASVTIVTQEGWRKMLLTDSEGRISFEMIRDYYPPWHEFNRRQMERFLVIAEYHSAEGGSHADKAYDGIHYKATSVGTYYPSTKDYQSYLYGLLIGLFGLTASAFGIYLYRRRRTDTYKGKRLA